MSVSSFREIYDRHRGPYALDFILEMDQKGRTVQGSDHLEGTYSAEDAHEEARILLKQRPEIVEIFVRSISENQYIGAFYRRGEDHRPWHEEEEHGRVELPDHEDRRSGWPPPASARPAPALVPEREEPLPAVDAPIDERLPAETLPTHRPVRDVPPEAPPRKRREPTKLPGDRFPAVRGRALGFVAERAEEWPSSAGPQALLTLIRRSPGPFRMTTAEIVQAMGSQLRELGVEHPASMVSRLKQAGLLHDVPSCV